jgi:ABC-type sugar transport system ATPase subunit
VGKRLFQRVVCGLLKGRTRVLVTHQLQYLKEPAVSHIVVLRQGRIVGSGDYEALMQQGLLGGADLKLALDMASSPTEGPGPSGGGDDLDVLERDEEELVGIPKLLERGSMSGNRSIIEATDKDTGEVRISTYTSLIAEEDKSSGVVSLHSYRQYVEVSNTWMMAMRTSNRADGMAVGRPWEACWWAWGSCSSSSPRRPRAWVSMSGWRAGHTWGPQHSAT